MSVVHCFTYGTMMAIGIWALGSVMALHLQTYKHNLLRKLHRMLLTMLVTCLGGVIGGRSSATTVPRFLRMEHGNVSGCINRELQAAAAAAAVSAFLRCWLLDVLLMTSNPMRSSCLLDPRQLRNTSTKRGVGTDSAVQFTAKI